MAILFQFRLGLLCFGDVDGQSSRSRGAVDVGEREVGDVVVSAVRPGPLPMVRCGRSSYRKGFAIFTGFLASEQVFVAGLAVALAKMFAEVAVGKGYVVIRRQQHHVGRQRVEDFVKPPPLGLDGFLVRPRRVTTSRAAANTPCTCPASLR